MKNIKITKQDAKKFLIRSMLLDKNKLPAGNKSVQRVIDHLNLVQVDSIGVAGTNQEIMFNSRVKSFVPDQLDHAMYEKSHAFEYYNKALCIIPMDRFPYYQVEMRRRKKAKSDIYKEHSKTIKGIIKQIGEDGPACSTDFSDDRKIPGWWIGDDRLVKRLLDMMWECGDIMIHHRKGRIRYFDLTERLAPNAEKITSHDVYIRRMILDLIAASRLYSLTGSGLGAWYLDRKVRNRIHDDFLKKGIVTKVEIEGSKRDYYMLTEDEKYLRKKTSIPPNVKLIAPLDNLTWDRDLVSDIFDFECTFEVYKPPKKRVYGYYCLFILCGTDFVGRVDISSDRKAGVMKVNSVHWEDSFKQSKEFRKNFESALDDHRRFMSLEGIEMYN